MGKNKIVKSATLLTILNLLSKVLGFIRDILIASNYGTTYKTDAYNMAITIPNIVFGIIGIGITTTFIPIFSDILKKQSKEKMFEFANNIMTIVSIISMFLGIIAFIFSEQLVKIIAPNFTGEIYSLTVTLTQISVVNIVFMSLVAGFNAILQTLDDFRATAYMSILINIPIIIYILFVNNLSIIGLTIITVLGNSLQLLIQIPYLYKYGYKYKININLKEKKLYDIVKLLIPVIIGTGVAQINDIVDKMLGSYLPIGSISSLNLAQRINSIIHSVFIATIITIVYPRMSKYINENINEFKKIISKTIIYILIIIVPTVLIMIILSKEIISIVFERGQFDSRSVNMTSTALIFYSVGTIFYGIRDVLNRAFYSLQDTKSPMKNSIIGVFCNSISNILLVKILGIGGLALGTSISAIVTSLLLINNMEKKIGKTFNKQFYDSIFKIVLISSIIGLELLIMKYLGINNLIILLTVSMITYLLLILILNIDEISELKQLYKKKVLY